MPGVAAPLKILKMKPFLLLAAAACLGLAAAPLRAAASRPNILFILADDPHETRDLARAEPRRLAELQRLLVEEMRQDDVGRVHRTAQFQWSRVPEHARLIQPAPARKSAEP